MYMKIVFAFGVSVDDFMCPGKQFPVVVVFVWGEPVGNGDGDGLVGNGDDDGPVGNGDDDGPMGNGDGSGQRRQRQRSDEIGRSFGGKNDSVREKGVRCRKGEEREKRGRRDKEIREREKRARSSEGERVRDGEGRRRTLTARDGGSREGDRREGDRRGMTETREGAESLGFTETTEGSGNESVCAGTKRAKRKKKNERDGRARESPRESHVDDSQNRAESTFHPLLFRHELLIHVYSCT
ncbi:uncharacterized protein [Aristolochia californica]|uniref:uncharacterized protein n=1 Tax=Aristolochia californica TaxID=171875 RepID=UPI0035D6016A